jgi:hypothetical protein
MPAFTKFADASRIEVWLAPIFVYIERAAVLQIRLQQNKQELSCQHLVN